MEVIFQYIKKMEHITKNMDLFIAVSIIAILTVMLVPMAPWMLDISLTISLALSLLILMVSLYTNESLDFSVFPSLLLITTLFRLSLNVASTRLILSQGHNGVHAAGAVIESFGHFVVGNNYTIGAIVFVIVVIINFVVITKGSGRVAEVAARFTLDAMPGKQMSIDADLNAGLINEDEARRRRKHIESEADFYGAMDGASKFVRGDAIAGIIITIINIVGGLLIGVLEKGLTLSMAAEFYTKMTIGDGLVSQIPALIISTAAGTIVTKTSSDKNIGTEMVKQLFASHRALMIVAVSLLFLGLLPGLPFFPFFLISFMLSSVVWFLKMKDKEEVGQRLQKEREDAARPSQDKVENLLPLDLIELEVGYGLISVIESNQKGDLLERIVSIRKQFALDMGIIVPSVHIRDNLQLVAGEYRILIKGNKVTGGTLRPDCLLAMDPGNVMNKVAGIPTKEPAFGLDAVWISVAQKEEAELAGYTVVDLPTIIATHLTEIIRTHAHELISRQEVSYLVEHFKKTYPKVVEELISDILSLGSVVRVLQGLLKEQVPIRDLLTIFETLADEGQRTKDPELLVEAVRKSLSRNITKKFTTEEGQIPLFSFSPNVEELLSNSLLQTETGVQLVIDPLKAQALIDGIAKTIESNPAIAGQPVLLTSPLIRRHIYKLVHRFIPSLSVISHNELTPEAHITSVDIVELTHAS